MVYRKVILQFPRTPQAVQVLVLIIVFVKALVQMTEFNPSEDQAEVAGFHHFITRETSIQSHQSVSSRVSKITFIFKSVTYALHTVSCAFFASVYMVKDLA